VVSVTQEDKMVDPKEGKFQPKPLKTSQKKKKILMGFTTSGIKLIWLKPLV
jgi:hypothetical protein